MADAENKMTTDYSKLPSNTDKEKADQSEAEERETLPQLTDTPAGRRKKPVGRKFREAITGDDARSVVSYVFFDVVVPAAKDMFLDAVNEGLVRALWGDVRRSTKRVARGINGSSNDYVPYNRVQGVSSAPSGGGAAVGRSITQKARATHDFDEITLGSRGEAEVVLNALQARIAQFSVATVSDLYDYVGITGSWTDNKYGWYDLVGASIDRAGRDGYVLSLPKPELLN